MSDQLRDRIPSAAEIRKELLDAVLQDLLGPAGGPREELLEDAPRERYLVGQLAPGRQEVEPETNDDLSVGGEDSGDEGAAEPAAPASRTLFPSSFGMSFSVSLEAPALVVEAFWGQYLRENNADGQRVWRRYPRGGKSQPVPLAEGRLKDWVPDKECPEVVVQGLARRRDDHWAVTLFLVNKQQEGKRNKDQYWLYQPELAVSAPDGEPVFSRRRHARASEIGDPALIAENRQMEMLYRHRVEFAVGHGVSVHAETPAGRTDRATRLTTSVIPAHEVPQVQAPTAEDFPELGKLTLDMKELSESAAEQLPARLRPLITAYGNWIDQREKEIGGEDLRGHEEAARTSIANARKTLERIEEGVKLLEADEDAARAFRFANRAMALQRVQSVYAEQKRRGEEPDLAKIDIPKNRSWRPFQLAFLLLNLPGLTKLDHPDRTGAERAVCDLLWFPTGGGKTEAYLGLAAYTMAIRRLQGAVEGRSGEAGLAVLMRYTLRLLTLQQFQRAAALVCACEVIRREALEQDQVRWGETPFRLGLWVGQKVTPNSTNEAAEAIRSKRGDSAPGGASGSPHQLSNCPWCGSAIKPGRDIEVDAYPGLGKTTIYCPDLLGQCPFSRRQAPNEGIPVVVVDEEIYRRLPSMMIATVDKFAQMPWNGRVQMLFGRVDGLCERHGYRSPEVDDADSHPAKGPLPKARTIPQRPLRPPDLIIQDELHLISGPLGSLVGLYETAVDELCAWEAGGRKVRPKIIASTATIRKAGDQVYNLFLRQLNIFPPAGLDVRDNFFSLEREPSGDAPGRMYIGVCATGRRLKAALIRVYLAFLAGGQQLYDKYGKAADPYMTLVGYFNSLRELGGMRRLVDDDIRTRLRRMDRWGLAKRQIRWDTVEELTSRKGSTEIRPTLDWMEAGFEPEKDKLRERLAKERRFKEAPRRPIDVLLATNMISVGVDIRRLGLMVVAGQPKTTAEYIQATSRVGRGFPGVVCTVYNWARPRDLSHYETFEHYHATFYKHVEALSVTPYSAGAIDRGLTAQLVSCVRLMGDEFNPNSAASRLERNHPYVQRGLEAIARRAELLGGDNQFEGQVRAELNQRLDTWLAEAQNTSGGRVLSYRKKRDRVSVELLKRPGEGGAWDKFTCLNSLREVEPAAGLVLKDGGLDQEAPDSIRRTGGGA